MKSHAGSSWDWLPVRWRDLLCPALLPGERRLVIGLVGAFMGGLVGTTISPDKLAPFDLYAVVTAAVGAMILLFLYRCVAMRFEVTQTKLRPVPVLLAKSA